MLDIQQNTLDQTNIKQTNIEQTGNINELAEQINNNQTNTNEDKKIIKIDLNK